MIKVCKVFTSVKKAAFTDIVELARAQIMAKASWSESEKAVANIGLERGMEGCLKELSSWETPTSQRILLKEMEENSVRCRGMAGVCRAASLRYKAAPVRLSFLMGIVPEKLYSWVGFLLGGWFSFHILMVMWCIGCFCPLIYSRGDRGWPQEGPGFTPASTYEARRLAGLDSAGLRWCSLTTRPDPAVSC